MLSIEQELLVKRLVAALAMRHGRASMAALEHLAIELGLMERDSAWVLEQDGLLYEKTHYRLAKVIAARLLQTWEGT